MKDKNTLAIKHHKTQENIWVNIRRSPRAKRMHVTISPQKGVELILPKHCSRKIGIEFLNEQQKWIAENVSNQNAHCIHVKEDTEVPFLGTPYKIKYSGSHRGRTTIDKKKRIITVSGMPEEIGSRVERFLHAEAKEIIHKYVDIYTSQLGEYYNKITLKDTFSRWGSCSTLKNLNFSWRLVMMPENALTYVVAHEVSHLQDMSHSKNFWRIVESLHPEYEEAIDYLYDEGPDMLLYHFKDINL